MKYDNIKVPAGQDHPQEFRTVVEAFWPKLSELQEQFEDDASEGDDDA